VIECNLELVAAGRMICENQWQPEQEDFGPGLPASQPNVLFPSRTTAGSPSMLPVPLMTPATRVQAFFLAILSLELFEISTKAFPSALRRYKLRAHVSFEDLSPSLCPWASFSPSPSSRGPAPGVPGGRGGAGPPGGATGESGLVSDTVGWGGGVDNAGQASAQADPSGYSWHADPRLAQLGQRGIFPASTTRE
jgi:hypothetical protein